MAHLVLELELKAKVFSYSVLPDLSTLVNLVPAKVVPHWIRAKSRRNAKCEKTRHVQKTN